MMAKNIFSLNHLCTTFVVSDQLCVVSHLTTKFGNLPARSQRSTSTCRTIVTSYDSLKTGKGRSTAYSKLNFSECFIEDCRSRLDVLITGVAFCPVLTDHARMLSPSRADIVDRVDRLDSEQSGRKFREISVSD